LTVPVTFASFEASGSFTDRDTDGMAAEDAVRVGEGVATRTSGARTPLLRGTSFLPVLRS